MHKKIKDEKLIKLWLKISSYLRRTFIQNKAFLECIDIVRMVVQNNINKIPDILDTIDAISPVDEATNDAGAFAEPEISSWYSPVISACSLAIDIVSTTLGCLTTNLSEQIGNLESAEDNH